MTNDSLKKFTMEAKWGSALTTGFMGTTKYFLQNLLEEYYNPARHDITGVFEASRTDTNTNESTHCVIMICEQLNPGLLDPDQITEDDDQSSSACSTRYWENRLIFDSCFNPYENGNFIENLSQTQRPEVDGCCSFPGGYLHLFVAAIPCEFSPMSDMLRSLTEDDLSAIKLALYKLPASKRNQAVLPFVSSSSSSSSSANTSSRDDIYSDMAAIWYDYHSKRIWVADNTVSNWYARESETVRQRQQQQQQHNKPADPQKQFEEFWMRFVKGWEHCRRDYGHAVDVQKVSSSFQLCFRDRDGSSRSQGSSSFSDSTISSPASDKGWTMIGDGSASS